MDSNNNLDLDVRLQIGGSGSNGSNRGRSGETIVLPSGALEIDGKKTFTVLGTSSLKFPFIFNGLN